nr:unnamed protein product [Digitaria exilis]
MYTSDEWLRSNPSVMSLGSPSFAVRQELSDEGVPRLGAEAALNAINDWGKQACHVTHLVMCTTASGCMPGADFEVAKLLGLPLSTKRFMLYQVGCHGGGLVLRLAKDLAENNPGARVLVVCSEVVALGLRAPSGDLMGNLVGQALFGDAAGAVIVGADPTSDEQCLFEMVWASQDILPGSEDAVVGKLREEGLVYNLHRDLPRHIECNIERLVTAALEQAGAAASVVNDWNEGVFWVMHAGGRDILDRVERTLGLRNDKLAASREVMKYHGNTMGSCVMFALGEMRRRSAERGPGVGVALWLRSWTYCGDYPTSRATE